MSEAVKNFLVCAVLMLACGICFVVMGKTNMGIGCIIIAVVLVIMAFTVVPKDENRQKDKQTDKNSAKKKGQE